MAMSVTEANAVNHLLRWLLDAGRDAGTTRDGQALEAAALLADSANKRLSAGLTGERVRSAWPPRRVKRLNP